ncbi:aldo/keto reductase [Enterobacter asburiae]|uniref:aldo/keto reductase n=1 Tax=Enterobacter TaxID=547 RepID=UPI001868FBBF|nr:MULTISPECIES: aldo/keto reductase [Enterobacter]MBE3492524.1 aldo/keto reductase [Enterobacter cloacae complex sp. P12RS]MCK7288915.1 aldo/keto reductase [Enterobacter bugandensis]MDV5192619.1 aldo/keto reductase [Enterobacter asburiae]MDV5268820.1 aldo/keto reductase [Enterobacter asburiae]HDC4535879.1 aldo/keto reductase [Enterobacter asburiae]
MKMRRLGSQGLLVSEMGLGCMGMDHGYGYSVDIRERTKLIDKAVELGCNLFDTAPIYGFENEELLGIALKKHRDSVVIATKFGVTGMETIDGQLVPVLDSSPASVRKQLEGSLSRLQTDHIDLFYQHRVDPKVEPEVVAGLMKELIAEGKIKYWGLSNAPASYIRRAHAVCPVTAVEDQYSMMWRKPEQDLFKVCDELDIGFMAYSPLGNGFLSGQVTVNTTYGEGDYRGMMGRFKPEVMENNQSLLNLIADIAERNNATSAQVVLAWELAQKPYIVPIPGTTKLHRLEENFQAANVQLSDAELNDINEALSKIQIDETFF